MVNVWKPLSLFLCTSTDVAVDVFSLKLYREEKVPLTAVELFSMPFQFQWWEHLELNVIHLHCTEVRTEIS